MIVTLIAVSSIAIASFGLLFMTLVVLGRESKRAQAIAAASATLQLKLKATEEVAIQYAKAYESAQAALLSLAKDTPQSWH